MKLLFAIAALTTAVAPASAAEWATLKLKVLYDGPPPTLRPIHELCNGASIPNEVIVVGKSGELSNLALIMDMRASQSKAIHPDLKQPPQDPVKITADCLFEPRIAFVRSGQHIAVRDVAQYAQNFKLDPFASTPVNVLLPIGDQIEVGPLKNSQANFVEFGCVIHPWMRGKLIIRDHPYVGLSDKRGDLVIEKLPVGKVTFKLVHEAMNHIIKEVTLDDQKLKTSRGRFEVELKPGMNDLGKLVIAANQFDLR